MEKKIAVCTYDAPLFHGPNTWLKRLLPELRKNGFSIHILFFFEGSLAACETYQFFFQNNFKVDAYPYKSIAEEKITWVLNTLAVDPPDIFIPHNLVHAFYAARYVKKAGIPTIGFIHSDEKFYNGIIEEFVNGEEDYKVTAVVACSQYLFERVNTKKSSNTISKCIPCGVPITNAPSTHFSKSTLKLVYTGRLVERQKRISAVVTAMCKACNEIEGVEGVLYGDGDVATVKSLIEENSTNKKVKFGGNIPNEKIFTALAHNQVFVLLSDYEGLPQSLLEAMACGLVPVCTSMKSGIPELIENGKTGIIVNNRDLEFMDAIRTLKNNLELCESISENVKRRVINYSSEVCTQAWINLLDELLAKKEPGSQIKIEVPKNIRLPHPHRYFRYEDVRKPTVKSKLLSTIRKMKLARFLKKALFQRKL